MEGNNSGGLDASRRTTSPKKGREHFANTDREIDQHHLAELLRKSANIVERGEFGSVLYEALQDFRVYYKQKYPKNAKKKRHPKKEHRDKSERGGRSVPVNATASDEKLASSNSNEILDDLKQSEGKTSEELDDKHSKEVEDDAAKPTEKNEKKLEHNGHTEQTIDQSERSVLECNGDAATSEPATTDNPDASAIDNSAESAPSSERLDDTTPPVPSDSTIPVVDHVDTVDVSEAPPTPSNSASNPMTVSMDSAVPMPIPGVVPEHSSTAETPNKSHSPFRASSAPTKNKVGFGKKFKLGATLQNVKKAAKNVKKNISENIHIEKMTSPKALDELEFYAETGVNMAESSGRRTQASQKSSGFKSRVTAGMAGASNAGSSEHEQNSDKFVSNQSYSTSPDNNHGRSGSDLEIGQPGSSLPPTSTSSKPVDPAFFESSRFVGKPPPVSKAVPNRFETLNTRAGEKQQNPSNFESIRFAPRHQPEGYKSFRGESASEDGDLNSQPIGEANHTRYNSEATFEEADPVMECDAKPKFQRPDNESSPLVVSGWIEQYRRSKMRFVWKEVLASLVEGRKPGEVTTLWIQREMINPSTGEKELEALHRIPLQILEDVSFSEHTTDYQFRLKIYNSTEDYVFRCNDAPNDALRWVQILKKYEKLTKEMTNNEEANPPFESESSNPFHQQPPSTKGMAIRDLRAICHGAGVNTAGMERSQLEAAAEEVQRRGTYFDQRGAPSASSAQQQYAPQQQKQEQQQHHYPQMNHVNPDDIAPLQQEQQQQAPPRMGIKELRAICHGAGINTAGMERRELEAAAQEVQSRGTYFDAPIRNQTEDDAQRARREELRRQQQQSEELKKRREVEDHHRREVEAARQRAAYSEQEAQRRAAEEEARRRAIEEEQRRRAAEEEARRRAAAEEQRRRQREAQEAQNRYAQQQAAWQQQHQVEEQRRRAAEQQAAAEHRRREEARRKEQEWAAPAPGGHAPQQTHQYHPQQQQQRHQGYPPQQQWQQQQQHRPPPQAARHTPPPPQQQQERQHSGTDNKYAKMASQSGDDGQATITKIKHSILIQWALQPPQLQMLRPIAALVTTIHTVFPPALGVSGHDYFKKWKPIGREELAGANGLPEEAKLKKAVRKIRFFLHPDKLPHDLEEEQKFTVKMLWDITNDSWEEYQKHKEDLDWVN